MSHKLLVPPLGWYLLLLDKVLVPFMCLLQGTFREVPQRTHFYNNKKLSRDAVQYLDPVEMVSIKADPNACPAWLWRFIPRFHIPIIGGWKQYVVIVPVCSTKTWHVGWIANVVTGVSQVDLTGPVRLLRGDRDAEFFGVDSEGRQIPIKQIGAGRIGEGGEFSHFPLL